jgi:hypothetical protein
MFPHLRLWLLAIWASSIAGAVVILRLTLGHYELSTFLWAIAAGLVLGIPAALLNWVYLRPNRSREVGLFGQIPPKSS